MLIESDTRSRASSISTTSATRKATFLLARRPWIKPDEMAAMEPIALKARDGLSLHGYLTRPPGKGDAKNLPLVVFVHGGPYFVRDRWGYDPDVQMLASRGYAVLQVNFRGSGGYGAAFRARRLPRVGRHDAGRCHRRDEMGRSPKASPIRSASAFSAAATAATRRCEGAVKEPDLYRCAIGYVGVYDLRLMYTRGDMPQSTYRRELSQDGARRRMNRCSGTARRSRTSIG